METPAHKKQRHTGGREPLVHVTPKLPEPGQVPGNPGICPGFKSDGTRKKEMWKEERGFLT